MTAFPYVLRGGSWIHGARLVRCARHLADSPSYQFYGICGFRLVAEVKEGEGEARTLRGGSWFFVARLVRCAVRYAFAPGYRRHRPGICGFRPVADPPTPR